MDNVKLYRYALPSVNGLEGWAIIVIGSDGYFSTVSDYGNYAYWWSAHERDDFRKFLLIADADYIQRKLNYAKVFDDNRTRRNMKAAVIEARQYNHTNPKKGMNREVARDAWDEVSSVNSEFELNDWFNSWAQYLGDYYGIACYMPEPQVVGFIKHILPRLKQAIRDELASESQFAQVTL